VFEGVVGLMTWGLLFFGGIFLFFVGVLFGVFYFFFFQILNLFNRK
jgi:hypothetical protein